jgi:hypothetical protein
MTAKIKLNAASGGGSFSLQAPSSSSNNRVLTLPDSADGTIAKTSDINFTSYAIIADQKASNVSGGSFTNNGDRTRDLNTVITDPDSIVSISSNQFTLQAGTYLIRGYASAYAVFRNLAWVYDVTGSTNLPSFGTAEYGSSDQHRSLFLCRKTISSANVFEIRHRSQETRATNGFGVSSLIATNTYTFVEIFKEL